MGRGEGLFVYVHPMTSPVVFETVFCPRPVAVSSKGTSIDISCKSGKEKVFISIFVFSFSGKGGRISSGSSLSRYVVKNIALQKVDDSNPREAILKFAQVSCREIP